MKDTPDVPQDNHTEPEEGNEQAAISDSNSAEQSDSDSSSGEQAGLGRRRFLTAGLGAAATIVIGPSLVDAQQRRKPGSGGGGGGGQQKFRGPLTNKDFSSSPNFMEPEVATARIVNGESVLDFTIECDLWPWNYSCADQTVSGSIAIYNQKVPGATLVVDPGTRMNLKLYNNLPVKSPYSGDTCGSHSMGGTPQTTGPTTTPPLPQCFMHTNLHTHGLLVSPCSLINGDKSKPHCGPYNVDGINAPIVSSDDVLIDVYPQQSNTYCIDIPSFHEPGTYWYHSHLHGASGYQVSSGMGGALIIREPHGQQLVQPDRDKVWFMQEVYFDNPNPTMPSVYGNLGTPGGGSGGLGSAGFLINGLCQPTLQMKVGQTQRWRFINATATPGGLMKLRLIKYSSNPLATYKPPASGNPPGTNTLMYLIAVDGLSFFGFPPQPVRQHLIAAGQRADFLINIKEPGMYIMYKDAFPLDAVSLNATDANSAKASVNTKQVLGFIQVFPTATQVIEEIPATVPGTRPFYLQAIGKVDKVRTDPVTFDNPNKDIFQVNKQYYDPQNVPIQADLNTAEEWTLQNTGGGGIPHPFHIHVNPFQIVNRPIDWEVADADRTAPKLDPTDPCNWVWADTVSLPAQSSSGTPGQVKIRQRFLVYPGEYVLHCHILVHEDVGMMANVKINDPKKDGIGPCVPREKPTDEAMDCVKRTMKKCGT